MYLKWGHYLGFIEDNKDDIVPPDRKVLLLDSVFKILSDFWFNECVPGDFKRTVLRPFLKGNDKDSCDPSNYRPISLLNNLMKVYEGIICKRLVSFLEDKKILSTLQTAYCRGRSTFDDIFTLHEITDLIREDLVWASIKGICTFVF